MDIFEKAFKYNTANQVREAGLYPYFLAMEGNEGTEAIYQGKRIIMCGSNNYLGLTTHPKVQQAAIDAIKQYGTSCTGSRFLNGTLEMHLELESQLADYVGMEAALVFSTGMQVNLGVVSSIVGKGEVVILDKDDHASIVDGARLSFGEMKRFRHNDLDDLERVLKLVGPEKNKLVVVDGLFSMEGDIAPLPEMLPLVRKYNARLMVDDAHAIGVLGRGRGTAAHFNMQGQIDLMMGTFSKSFASLGGFIAGEEKVIDYIQHNARSLIFSASIPPSNTAAALAALHIMRDEPERVDRLTEIATRMREGFTSLGFDIGNSETPVIPIIVGEDMKTFQFWRALLDAGVYVNAVISPATAPGRQLLRTSYMATHTDEQLDQVLDTFYQVGKKLSVI
ncbi:MAG: aminotransferase class I/II-fold pyridoxal phosphate-dependent enzyme [Anaerolineales bacterium]|nr:aminotransferase class I/II-fold pyridoxal phosphate-dependent enzyme [Anaerolineales bacterium]